MPLFPPGGGVLPLFPPGGGVLPLGGVLLPPLLSKARALNCVVTGALPLSSRRRPDGPEEPSRPLGTVFRVAPEPGMFRAEASGTPAETATVALMEAVATWMGGELAFRFPRATLDAHVDDVAPSAYGVPSDVRDRVVEFSHDFHLTLELDMDAEVAKDKLAVVAGSRRLVGAIARTGCGLSQRDCDATVALGADVTVAKPGGTGRGALRGRRESSVSKRA